MPTVLAWGGPAAVAGMYAAFLAVGWLAARKARRASADELMVAGRSMPLWVAVMTMTATWVDGGYLLGTTEGAFKPGGGVASGLQGGLCFGLSLVLGGMFFARRMRERRYTTLGDAFEARFGRAQAAVLCAPAMLAEVIWSAELLVAVGATLEAVLGLDLRTAILMSAAVVVAYTMAGGLWSVAYTDAFQLALIPLGLLAALPFALEQAGGLQACLARYAEARAAEPAPTAAQRLAFWDTSLMLALGGIPWNCYFQRVLSCETPEDARRHSYIAGLLTMALTVPPLLVGMAAFAYPWPPELAAALRADPSAALPYVLRHLVPPWAAVLGLGAIIGAVTSSLSASILSASSMIGWNVYRRLLAPGSPERRLRAVLRGSILFLGAAAAAMALGVRSVQQLWFFTSDLVFVLLVPQLVMALFDPKANRAGSMAAFAVSLALRLGGGEPLLGLPRLIPYPEAFPFKTAACAAGFVLLPLVSRLKR